jgi:hypothetical protein
MDPSRTYPDVEEIVVRFHGPLNWHLLGYHSTLLDHSVRIKRYPY